MTALQDALAHIKQATITPDQWLAKVRGYRGYTTEQLHATAHYKAHVALWNAAHAGNPAPVPTPAHPPDPSLAVAQSWFIIAENWQYASAGPPYFGRAFTADKGADPDNPPPTRSVVDALRERGIRTAGWADSRPSGGTSTAQLLDFCSELGVDRPIFQAERIDECRASMDCMDALGGSGHVLIVNLTAIKEGDSAMWAELSARIKRGNVLAQAECYKNCGWGGPNWENLPVACTLAATYKDRDCPGLDQDTYYANGWMAPRRDSWYTAQWQSADYAAAR